MPLKLGKRPFVESPHDFLLSTYLDTTVLPPLPATIGHASKMPKPRLMLGNGPDNTVQPGFQGAGCCVWSGIANMIRLANGLQGKHVNITGATVIRWYSKYTGYVIGDDSTDDGTDMRTALTAWRRDGLVDEDGVVHKLGAFALLDLGNETDQLQALHLFDVGVFTGIMFPPTAMQEFDENKEWSGTGKSDEGHAIVWDEHHSGYENVETWARDQKATANFMTKQSDEKWAVFLPEILNGMSGKTLEGLNVAQLNADLAAL